MNQYIYTTPTQTVLEDFDPEAGTMDPLNWTSDPAGNWLGTDAGTATVSGKYAYGTTENSLGILTGAPTTFTALYLNDPGAPITAMQISYDAQFELKFTFTPGAGAGTPSTDVFLNKVHYDNDSIDTGDLVNGYQFYSLLQSGIQNGSPDSFAIVDSAILSFPTVGGRTYTIYRTTDFIIWNNLGSHPGTGSTLDIPSAGNPAFDTNIFRVGATLP